MPYAIPTFNLLCNIVGINAFPGPWRIANQPCALTYGRRSNTLTAPGANGNYGGGLNMALQLPALTDIRSFQDSIAYDVVECPAGSGRPYIVIGVDDIGKGYPNEHRTGILWAPTGSWTAPYP